jgi:hypothetical protein
VLLFHQHFVGDPACRETTATHGVSVSGPNEVHGGRANRDSQRLRQRIANALAKKRTAQRKTRVRPTLGVSEPNYDDSDVLTPRLVAAVFSVHPKTVARWADAGVLPSFRKLGGQGL